MEIRSWRPADEQAIDALIASLSDDGAGARPWTPHGSDQRPPLPFRQTLVARVTGELIGTGTLWENSLHPTRWRVTLHGRPVFWSEGTADALLSQLRALRPDRRFLQTGFSVTDAATGSFFRQRGFAPIMRTRAGTLDPEHIQPALLSELDSARDRLAALGCQFVTFRDSGSASEFTRDVAELHATIYRHGHRWDPPRSLTTEEATDLFLDPDDMLPGSLFLVMDNGMPVAVSSLRRGPGPYRVDLGWTGVSPTAPFPGPDLVYALVGMAIQVAIREHWSLDLEIDQADPVLWALTERLPVAWEPDWMTLAESDESRQFTGAGR